MKNQIYKIKLVITENSILGFFINKKIKAIGHGPLKNQNNILVVTHKDKIVSHINREKYLRIEYSKELFVIQAENIQEKSNNQVNAKQIINS